MRFNKALGPEGANFFFYKRAWHLIKDDLSLFKVFYENSSLPSSVHASFITLVPKVRGPSKTQDFRPISLINGIYKIVAKVLAVRHKKVLPSIISKNQSAFVFGSQILDCFLITFEIIDFHKKNGHGCFLFKIDFEKAFDSISWMHLDNTMSCMDFGSKWRSWIWQCISNAGVNILINGCPSIEFLLENGLRQGDPLSLFLFSIVVDPLRFLIKKAVTLGHLHGVRIGSGSTTISISYQMFTDDTLFFTASNVDYVLIISRILR